MPEAWLLDVDGTLVDTNYHHALAWFRAFRAHDLTPPLWRLHRHVGMGGDKFVAAVAGEDVEQRLGDELRERWQEEFDEIIDEVQPLEGARDLVVELKRRGHAVVLASSAIQEHLDHFVGLLDVADLVDATTGKDDVERSKPDPDLVKAALAAAGGGDAIMLGDTPWDVAAASRAGIGTACVLTGGFGEPELRDAGAIAVFESLRDVLAAVEHGELP
jgi:HAD superfamily hydrolase (TIGR01549 family)